MRFIVKLSKGIFPYILIIGFIWLFYIDDIGLKIEKNPTTNIKECVIHAFNKDTNEKAAVLYGSSLIRDALNNAVTLYDSTGEIFTTGDNTHISANITSLDAAGIILTFQGDVVAHREPDTYLYTSVLLYNIKKQRLYTHANVTIDEPDKITTGTGLESNVRLRRARILNNVRVKMKD